MSVLGRIKIYFREACFEKLRRQIYSSNTDMATLETLKFDNIALKRLPIDKEERNYVRTVADACFSKVKPTPVEKPATIAYSTSAMALLDLPVSELERKDFAEYFSGNILLPGSDPAAHCYCGHQFGHFTGQLGDGAAIYLGEIINAKNERWEIQLKGAGLTPYSRTADGRKVMRSSIREFLCSEAMHFLNIPTTRAGSCITSETEVVRDIFYDGRPIKEKCTIVSRIAPTFLRFGSFEIFKTLDPITRRCGPSVGKTHILIDMLDYTIETFYPEIHQKFEGNNQEKYAKFFEEVVCKTAQLVAEWQCVGFCHGVLNTDNMSIMGLTIDYGPFGFMDMFNPDHICNASDDSGRYTYTKQPEICLWNLKKLAEAIQTALPLTTSLKSLELFEKEFNTHYLNKMRQKLGLFEELAEDISIIEALFDTMEHTGADFTNTFRYMSSLLVLGLEGHEASLEALKHNLVENCCYPLDVIIENIGSHSSSSLELLLLVWRQNPELAQQLGGSMNIDLERLSKKMEWTDKLSRMTESDKKSENYELWSEWLSMYCLRLERECKDNKEKEFIEEFNRKRVEIMNRSNPRFILRNYILQNAIQKAEAGDFSAVRNILKRLENPFEDSLADIDFIEPSCSTSVSSNVVHDDLPKENEGENAAASESQICSSLPPKWAFGIRIT